MTHRGVTLLELLVVLTILSLLLGVSGLAIGSLEMPRDSRGAIELRRARSDAIRYGVPRTIRYAQGRLTHHRLFLPDGRAIGAGVDQLTGAPLAK